MNNFKPWSEFSEFQEKLLNEINKGVDMANEHFKKKGIKAKAFNVDKVVIYGVISNDK